jgi:hypothetical protein
MIAAGSDAALPSRMMEPSSSITHTAVSSSDTSRPAKYLIGFLLQRIATTSRLLASNACGVRPGPQSPHLYHTFYLRNRCSHAGPQGAKVSPAFSMVISLRKPSKYGGFGSVGYQETCLSYRCSPAATYSPIAIDEVSPGLSMPKRAASPGSL